MSMIKRISADTIGEFADKIEKAKQNFIPMLPFVKLPLHDFDRYKLYSERGIYLIDYIDDDDGDCENAEYCLYHLYHLSEGDDTLRATLILPSNWDKRFEIIEKSIPNVKEWFLKENHSAQFIIQSLEYGEVEYYPTLSHYLIPTIIRNGFHPKYRMYMKRDFNSPIQRIGALPHGLSVKAYSDEMYSEVEKFYYQDHSMKNFYYFTNCTYEEFQEMFQQDFTIANSKFVVTEDGRVVAGILVSSESGKVWVDNFSASPELDGIGVAEYLLSETMQQLSIVCPEHTVVIYLNRDCHDAVCACEKNGFGSFEFWTDMILER